MTKQSKRAQLHAADAAGEFALSGNATLTLQSQKTGARFTYRIHAKEDKPGEKSIYFISLLNGPDNESDFAYLGHIRPAELQYSHGRKSKISAEAPSARAFAYFWEGIRRGKIAPNLEIWHEGRCGRCGRKLTTPESLSRGIGPECAKHS
jgi:hypothetical protein